MNAPDKEYLALVREKMPKSKHLTTVFRAFWTGGVICCIGEALNVAYSSVPGDFSSDDVAALTTITLSLMTAIWTGFGIYDKIGA